MNNYEKIKQMNIDEMAEVFEALMNGFVFALNMMLKDKNVMIQHKDIQPFKEDIEQWLLQEEL